MMKLEVSDVLYDSSSSVSSDSATSQGSRISHDFLANIGSSSYAPSSNLVSPLEGLHSGVPTRTTPTLTPTTLRTIEQSFIDFTNEPVSHSREAGFVPPLIEPSQPIPTQTPNNAIHQPQQPQHNNVLLEVQQQQQQQQQQLEPQQQQIQQTQIQAQQQPATATTRRNMGGRRPTRTAGMSPEEEERRQIRRERNKMAAARCRKRRMDHTNALLEETEGLEQKKQNLKDEIQELQQMKMDLEMMLESHRTVCRLHSSSPPDVKPVIVVNNKAPTTNGNATDIHADEFHTDYSCNKQQQQHQEQHNNLNNGLRPNRPNSLPVGFDNNNQQRPTSLPIFTEPKPRPSSLHFKTLETPAFMKTAAEVAGIPITTPSSGIPFNFDSLMEGGTGLTPVSTPLVPSCSSQQRNNGSNSNVAGHHHLSAVDLSSPDTNPPKLVSL